MSQSDKRALLARLLEKKAGQPRDAPVSFAQRRLWLLDRLDPDNRFYNVSRAVRIRGALDRDILARSFDALVARHEVLRTVLVTVDDEPMQRILPAAHISPTTIETRDLRDQAPAQRLPAAHALAREEAVRLFDLARLPLFRVLLIQLDDQDHLLVLTMHHIVTDGWSMRVLSRELGALYHASSEARAPQPAPLPIQYADFARWQRDELHDEALGSRLAYWEQKLDGAPRVLELPTTFPRQAMPSHRGALFFFDIPAALAERMRRLAREESATPYMAMLAAFYVLLFRYTGQDDILVGSTTAGRTRPEVEPLIGFFVNTLTLRGDLRGAGSFRALLRRVRETTLEAQRNQDLPFDVVVEHLCTARDMSQTPLFQVLLDYQPAAAAPAPWPDLEMGAWEIVDKGAAIFDLSLVLEEQQGGAIQGAIQYSTDLFSEAAIARMSGHLLVLLDGIAGAPERALGLLPLLSADEERTILHTWNQTDREAPLATPLHRLFEERAARVPEHAALAFRDRSMSYAELDRAANRLAWLLCERGLQPGQRVALSIERSLEMPIAVLGILKAGGCYVPLDPEYPEERRRFMLDDCGAAFAVTVERLTERFAGFGDRVIPLDREGVLDGQPDRALDIPVSSEAPAYMIYTSGSTGRPKGVLVPHRGVVRVTVNTRYAHLREEEILLQISPLSFDTSVFDIWAALLGGHTLALMEPGKPSLAELARVIRHHRVTTMFMPTGLFQLAVQELPEALQPIEHLLAGGDVMPPAAAHKIRRMFPEMRLTNAYGPTEATVFASSYCIEGEWDIDRSVPIGRPIDNTKLYILDANMQPLPVGVPGELYIGGPGVALGYSNQPALTDEKFVPNPFAEPSGDRLYRTGDLVRYVEDGLIEFIGRIDNQVKVRGFRIELGEIEVAIQGHPAVRDAVAVVHGERAGEKQMVAYYVPGDGELTPESLHDYLRARLPDYMLPSFFIPLERLPLNPSGKVDRNALPALQRRADDEASILPRTPTEEALSEIWSDVLDLASIGVNRNFFELGGQSLLATQVVSRISKVLGVELALRTLFQNPTIAELARAIQAAPGVSPAMAEQPIPRLPRQPDEHGICVFPMSHAQQRMWFLDRLEGGNSRFYDVPWALRLTGPLDRAGLRRAFAHLVARHESLRTVFVSARGEPRQAVRMTADFELPIIDLSSLPGEERETILADQLAGEAAHCFDLERGPLFRAMLFALGEQEHLLLGNMHHIIMDGWSLDIILRELAAMYSGQLEGRAIHLPEPAVQYADYAAWQEQSLRSQALASQAAYWKEHLAGAPELLDLPTDRPRPPVQTFRGAQLRFRLPADLSARLERLSRQCGVTPYMVLLAAFDTLLHRYTGQDDILVGSPVANRNRMDTEGTVGVFINTVVLRARLTGDLTFAELLHEVRAATLEAQANQDIPFERVLEEVGVTRSPSHAPLFQVMFVMQNALVALPAFPGLDVAQVPVETKTSLVDLSLTMASGESGLTGFLEYNTDLFEPDTAARMMEHFRVLLEGIAADPAQRISEYPLMTAREAEQMAARWARPRSTHGDLLPVHRMIAAAAARAPEAEAVSGTGTLGFDELVRHARGLARHLRSLGVGGRGDLVGICMHRSTSMVTAMLAVLEAGAAFLPIDPDYPRSRKHYMAQDSRLSWVLASGDMAADFHGTIEHVLDPQRLAYADLPGEALDVEVGWDDPAYAIYTSGSTGQPKGVVISHRSLANHCRGVVGRFAIQPEDRALQFAAVGFDVALEEIFPTLAAGATVVLRPNQPVTLSGFAGFVREQRISILNLPAAFWHEWVDELARGRAPAMPALRLLVTGSDRVLTAKLATWRRLFSDSVRWLNGYGPTETTISSNFYEPQAILPRTTVVPLGAPLPNVRTYILDRIGRMVPVGVPGELCIGGDAVALGYLHRDQLGADKFVADPFAGEPGARLYKSGDAARFLPDGSIEFLGRMDQQVKVRGFRIELGEIESCLARHPHVAEAVVQVQGHSAGAGRLVAYVVPASQGELDVGMLGGFLAGELPSYMVPGAIVVMPAIPRTPNGKLDRRALPAPESAAPAHAPATPPSSEMEHVVAAIWSEVLGVPDVDVHGNFFDLGGSSLSLAKVHARLEEHLDTSIAIHDLFQYPTIRGLAEYLRGDHAGFETVTHVRPAIDTNARAGDIAIIGMAIRFPGADTTAALWEMLRSGIEALTPLSDEALAAAGVATEIRNHPDYVKVNGIIDNAGELDAAFFNYNPKEAELVDPQQRVLLECAWEALEDAGHAPGGPVGVFCGTALSTYLINNLVHSSDPAHRSNAALMQNDINSAATRISYKLNLFGPSLAVQTACSTSLVAVHMACRSLQAGECDMALAGGASIRFPMNAGYIYQKESIASPDGTCRAFDADAAGTVPGNGAAMVLLKPLDAARRDGDHIYAVVKGTAINNDGADKVGYTAPSLQGQAGAIRAAWAAARVAPATIGYVEAHGTGTLLGDPIEIAALHMAFRNGSPERRQDDALAPGSCAIGSIKTNIGHLDVAAGVAGLIKAALMLQHRQLVPSLHFHTPNPKIDFAAGPLYVNTESKPWPQGQAPRRAAVSSFGMGGTNAHAVLEEAPEREPAPAPRSHHLLAISARTAEDLDRMAARLANALRAQPGLPLADVCHTLQAGRKILPYRRAMICTDRDQAMRLLEEGDPRRVLSATNKEIHARVAFLFPGQGTQYPGMGAGLHRQEPVFRQTVDECLALVQPLIPVDLEALLFPGSEDRTEASAEQLRQTALTQPALFILEYAMARLLMSWGIEPAAMLGHSLGEYVAATLAGVFPLDDALRLVTMRGRLMQALPPGSMLAVSLDEDDLMPFLGDSLALAAVNGPGMCVASGPDLAVTALAERLRQRGIEHRALHTSHAFHSQMMDPILSVFAAEVARARLAAPRIPFVSNLTGTWITPAEAMSPDYWTRHLRAPVRFSAGLACLGEDSTPVLLELGPGHTLSSLARRQPGAARERIVSSMSHARERGDDADTVLGALARLWLAGVTIDWNGFHGPGPRRVPLPTYPFDRKRFFVDAGASDALAGTASTVAASAGSETETDQAATAAAPTYERPGLSQEYISPRSPLEARWTEIWRRVFGYADIGVRDNFYDLGGDSLSGLRIIALAAEHGTTVTLDDLFEHQTIEELAQALRPTSATDEE